jgi:hypothetical protein
MFAITRSIGAGARGLDAARGARYQLPLVSQPPWPGRLQLRR